MDAMGAISSFGSLSSATLAVTGPLTQARAAAVSGEIAGLQAMIKDDIVRSFSTFA